MSRAIANPLPTCICRTLGPVGFALGAETFTQNLQIYYFG
jgi:hypothetical protein